MTETKNKNTYDKEAIGKRIASKRKEKKLSQDYLAKKTHISQELIAKYEKGQRNIQNESLISIVDVLETNTDYILRGIDTQNLNTVDDLHLSNEAINNLRVFLGSDELMKLDNAKAAINWFLSNRTGFQMLAQLYAYLNADCTSVFRFVGEEKEVFSSDSLRIPLQCGVETERASYHLTSEGFADMMLQQIMFNLKNWRQEIQKTESEEK